MNTAQIIELISDNFSLDDDEIENVRERLDGYDKLSPCKVKKALENAGYQNEAEEICAYLEETLQSLEEERAVFDGYESDGDIQYKSNINNDYEDVTETMEFL